MLTNTGRREQRSRLLPAKSWYFVMATAVFQDGRAEVMRRLTEGLPSTRARHKEWAAPTTGATSQARDRLGEAPMKMLYERMAAAPAVTGTPGAPLGKHRLMAIYGGRAGRARYTGQYLRHPFPQSGNALVSMVMWLNCMKFVGKVPMPVAELERRSRTPANLDGMRRWAWRGRAGRECAKLSGRAGPDQRRGSQPTQRAPREHERLTRA